MNFIKRTNYKKIIESLKIPFLEHAPKISIIEVFADYIPAQYSLQALLSCLPYLSEKDYHKVLKDIWREGYYLTNAQSNSLLFTLFKIANPDFLMSKEEKTYYDKLPDTIIVYRGVELAQATKRAISWTPDIRVARLFAKGHDDKDLPPKIERKVLQAKISKKYVFGCLINSEWEGCDFKETEILVDPSYLKELKVIERY